MSAAPPPAPLSLRQRSGQPVRNARPDPAPIPPIPTASPPTGGRSIPWRRTAARTVFGVVPSSQSAGPRHPGVDPSTRLGVELRELGAGRVRRPPLHRHVPRDAVRLHPGAATQSVLTPCVAAIRASGTLNRPGSRYSATTASQLTCRLRRAPGSGISCRCSQLRTVAECNQPRQPSPCRCPGLDPGTQPVSVERAHRHRI